MSRPKKRPSGLYPKQHANGIWHIHWTKPDGKNTSSSTGTKDYAEAMRQLEKLESNTDKSTECVTVQYACHLYSEHMKAYYKRQGKKSTYDSMLYQLEAVTNEIGHMFITNDLITRMRGLFNQWLDKGYSTGTARKRGALLVAALNHCKREGVIEYVPTIPLPPAPPPRDRWLTKEEAKLLLSKCGTDHLELFMLLALHTLSRKTAILQLKWEQVDFGRKIINFLPRGAAQTKKRRVDVPINPVLMKALRMAKKAAVTDYVIEYNSKAPLLDIKTGFSLAVRDAGLKKVSAHTLRHTGASLLAQEGVPLNQIAQLMGDTPATVEEHYAKYTPEYLKTATKKLGSLYK